MDNVEQATAAPGEMRRVGPVKRLRKGDTLSLTFPVDDGVTLHAAFSVLDVTWHEAKVQLVEQYVSVEHRTLKRIDLVPRDAE